MISNKKSCFHGVRFTLRSAMISYPNHTSADTISTTTQLQKDLDICIYTYWLWLSSF